METIYLFGLNKIGYIALGINTTTRKSSSWLIFWSPGYQWKLVRNIQSLCSKSLNIPLNYRNHPSFAYSILSKLVQHILVPKEHFLCCQLLRLFLQAQCQIVIVTKIEIIIENIVSNRIKIFNYLQIIKLFVIESFSECYECNIFNLIDWLSNDEGDLLSVCRNG